MAIVNRGGGIDLMLIELTRQGSPKSLKFYGGNIRENSFGGSVRCFRVYFVTAFILHAVLIDYLKHTAVFLKEIRKFPA